MTVTRFPLSMLLREALRAGLQTLTERDIPSPQLAAELLLMHMLGCDRSYLYSHPDQPLAPGARDLYFQSIAERATGKPTQYITGHQEFWGLDFEVTPDVLIPRPETEHVVETALELLRTAAFPGGAPCILDVGTGSGCIALAIASELPQADIYAVDISPAALAVAQRNATRLGFAGRVRFREGDLLERFIHEGCADFFDLILSNPPYVGDGELDLVQREVREFEPRAAWAASGDGNEIYRRLFPQARSLLKPGGFVAVEIGYSKRNAVVGLLGEGWNGIEVRPDLAGIPRVVLGRKPVADSSFSSAAAPDPAQKEPHG